MLTVCRLVVSDRNSRYINLSQGRVYSSRDNGGDQGDASTIKRSRQYVTEGLIEAISLKNGKENILK